MTLSEDLDLTVLKNSNCIRQNKNVVYLDLEITPGASRTGIKGYNRWRDRILINIHSSAQKGLANKELTKFLSNIFDIHQNQIKIVKGKLTYLKTIILEDLEKEQIIRKLIEVTNEHK